MPCQYVILLLTKIMRSILGKGTKKSKRWKVDMTNFEKLYGALVSNILKILILGLDLVYLYSGKTYMNQIKLKLFSSHMYFFKVQRNKNVFYNICHFYKHFRINISFKFLKRFYLI